MTKVCPFMSGALQKITKNDPAHYSPSICYEPLEVECIKDRCMLYSSVAETCRMVLHD